MAAFPSRDEAAFREHWETRVLANDAAIKKTILSDGEVAGNMLAFERDGKVLVGYWLGREFWGRGVASEAVTHLLAEVSERPLWGVTLPGNRGSRRVLEKHGFTLVDEGEEVLYLLD